MSLKLLVTDVPMNIRKQVLAIAAKYAGVELEMPHFMPAMVETSQAFALNCHPMQKNPVLRTEDGYIFETNAILRYIARLGDKNNAGLYGRTAFEAAQVDQWLDFTLTELSEAVWTCLLHTVLSERVPAYKKTPEELKKAVATVNDAFCALNLTLEVRTFLVGERLTAADLAVATYLDAALRFCGDADLFTKYPHVSRYHATIYGQATFQEGLSLVLGAPYTAPVAPGK